MIFDVPGLRGLTCFEIAHSKNCRELWTSIRGSRTTNKLGKGRKGYSVSTSHPVYTLLLDKYGLSKKTKDTKRKRMDDIEAALDGWSVDGATPPNSSIDGKKGKSELFDTSSFEEEEVEVEEIGMGDGGNEVSVFKYLLKFWAAIRYSLTIIRTATQLLLSLGMVSR